MDKVFVFAAFLFSFALLGIDLLLETYLQLLVLQYKRSDLLFLELFGLAALLQGCVQYLEVQRLLRLIGLLDDLAHPIHQVLDLLFPLGDFLLPLLLLLVKDPIVLFLEANLLLSLLLSLQGLLALLYLVVGPDLLHLEALLLLLDQYLGLLLFELGLESVHELYFFVALILVVTDPLLLGVDQHALLLRLLLDRLLLPLKDD